MLDYYRLAHTSPWWYAEDLSTCAMVARVMRVHTFTRWEISNNTQMVATNVRM
jgi:hypothetical protein